jgi:hypothetical protein
MAISALRCKKKLQRRKPSRLLSCKISKIACSSYSICRKTPRLHVSARNRRRRSIAKLLVNRLQWTLSQLQRLELLYTPLSGRR